MEKPEQGRASNAASGRPIWDRMTSPSESLLNMRLADLRPTQITVGMREVREKRKRWEESTAREGAEFLSKHMIPVILGPKKRHYVADRHHLGRALMDAGVKEVLVTIVADLHKLHKDDFWIFLDHRNWIHPFDDAGHRRGYEDIPQSLSDLVDDPFRSLAGELRLAGGYSKDAMPFSEFVWADFLRRQIKRKLVEEDFDQALAKALHLAKSKDTDFLPGWCGRSAE